jgi:geranylgeranylglycerol-phosphate geranylgeranyltransferase
MKTLLRLPTLCRPLNCLITFLSVWIGAVVAGQTYFSNRILAASLSAAFVTAYGNIINDLFDIKADSINKPSRLLTGGNVNKSTAILLAILFALFGFALSFAVGHHGCLVALLVIILLLAYTPIFKGMNYLGNVLVAAVSSLAFIYGGIAVDKPFGALFLIVFAFLLHLGREIVKDIQDQIADSMVGYHTGASIANGNCSRALASLVLTILIAATFIPYFLHIYGLGYLIMVIVVDLLLSESINRLVISGSEDSARRVSRWLKLAMPIGLLAVLLGRLGL